MDKKTMMQKLAQEAFDKGGFNGAWLYAEKGEIISKGALGFRDPENKLPMTEDTIFEMASVTKMFTATAVMLLVREGKLGLDNEYSEYFPEFPFKGVTIRHLLTHTSGIPDYNVEELVTEVREQENRIPSNGSVMRHLMKRGDAPANVPGEEFCYTDIGYTLLAYLVEEVSGVKFEDFLKEKIFEPSGMKDSAILHTRRDGIPSDRIARNLVLEDGKYVPSDLSKNTAAYVAGSDGLNGCDYLYTTIFDMLAWDRALREEKVLSLEEQQIMYTPGKLNKGELIYDDDESYGFGWGIENDDELGLIVGHSGGMPGLNTWFEHHMDRDRMLVMMSTRDPEDVRAFASFWEGMMAIARDREAEPVVSIEDFEIKDPDKTMWESISGKYEHPEGEGFVIDEIFVKDGELWAKAIVDDEDYDVKGEITFKLYQMGENEFSRKLGFLKLVFGDGSLTMNDEVTCKKL